METSVFTRTVYEHAAFDSEEQARETIDAVLEAISESIARGLAEDAAEQLPEALAEHLLADETEEAEPLDYEEFLDRISEEAGVDREHTLYRTAAVMLALERALDEFEFENIRNQFPEEYNAMFATDAIATDETLSEAVTEEADLDGATAEEATTATLDVLSERLTLGETEDLAVHLGEEEGPLLVARENPDAEDFGPEEFVVQVAEEEGVDEEVASDHVTAVLDGLEAVAPEEVPKAGDQLDPEYDKLFPRD